MKDKVLCKIRLFFWIVLLWAGVSSLALYGQTTIRGDVNGDSAVNIIDALMIAQYSVGLGPAGFNVNVAEVSCDGTVNIIDALKVAQYYVGLVNSLNCGGTPAPTRTPTMGPTTGPTATPGTKYVGNSTWFDALGSPYGGCGLNQSVLDTQHFVALNVQNSPGDATMLTRPITDPGKIGMWNNGLNCGRWVRVTISDYCNGTNDGALGQPFCRNGSGWVTDAYNGATLDMIVADSCHDPNGWCRDDPNHLDLAHASLNQFVKDGKPVGDMDPNHFNNRQISWYFIEAPNYTGDIRIGFLQGAQAWWTAIAITHLKNGIHGVDYWDGSSWVKAKMNGDMGQSYIISPTVEGGDQYRIRVYDVNDQLINNGRIYNFPFAASCEYQCSGPWTEADYTIE